MIRSRLGLKALGLCAMVLGLMAFTASAAQAEAGANWMVNKANVTKTLLPTVQIGEIENGTASLLTEIAKAKVTFLCTGAELVGAKLELEGKLTEGGKVKFTNCVTILNGSLSKVCVPKTSGQSAGTIVSNEGKGLLVLHEGKGLTRIEPKTGETFLTLQFNVAEGCSLPETVPVKGKLFIKDCKGEEAVEAVSHLIEQGPLTHLFVISDTTEHAASIDGSATAILTGEHLTKTWSGLPG